MQDFFTLDLYHKEDFFLLDNRIHHMVRRIVDELEHRFWSANESAFWTLLLIIAEFNVSKDCSFNRAVLCARNIELSIQAFLFL